MGESCQKVPRMVCSDVTVPACKEKKVCNLVDKTVDKEIVEKKCTMVNKKQCQQIPQMQCGDIMVPVESCEEITENLCENVRKSHSIYLDYYSVGCLSFKFQIFSFKFMNL